MTKFGCVAVVVGEAAVAANTPKEGSMPQSSLLVSSACPQQTAPISQNTEILYDILAAIWGLFCRDMGLYVYVIWARYTLLFDLAVYIPVFSICGVCVEMCVCVYICV